MKALKELIELAEDKQNQVSKKESLVEKIKVKDCANVSGGGYCEVSFVGERKKKILSLLNEFIEEDKAALEPLTTKLNLISDLVEGK